MTTEPEETDMQPRELERADRRDAAAIIETMRDLHGAQLIAVDAEGALADLEGGAAVIPRGMKVIDLLPMLDRRLPAPRRRKGTAKLTTLDSFVAHVKRFADTDSAIFAISDPKAPKLVAVLDYHRDTSTGAPRFGEHRSEYAFPLSDEWVAWTTPAERSQRDFAAFIEDRLQDILPLESIADDTKKLASELGLTLAGAQTLLTTARGLSLRVDQKITNVVNLSSGEMQVGYEEKHDAPAGTTTKVPSAFAIGIPVFKNGARYSIPARLRYRLLNGTIAWRVDLHRASAVFDDAFAEACQIAAKDTSLPVYQGSPEV